MKKIICSLALLMGVGFVFTHHDNNAEMSKAESTQFVSPNVAWAVYELTECEAAAAVSGTSIAIGATQATVAVIKGASWGARIGAFTGPVGCFVGALAGGL